MTIPANLTPAEIERLIQEARNAGYVRGYKDGLEAGLLETLHPEQPVTLISENIYMEGTLSEVIDALEETRK